MRATSEIEYAYAQADALLLSFRLNPLPNVAIDMLLIGKPVFCFARTTGIAGFLREAGIAEHCAAQYLDATEMAAKIRCLSDDPAPLATVAERGAAVARQSFNAARYAERLDEIAISHLPKHRQMAHDIAYIQESVALRRAFCAPIRETDGTEEETIRRYLESNRIGH